MGGRDGFFTHTHTAQTKLLATDVLPTMSCFAQKHVVARSLGTGIANHGQSLALGGSLGDVFGSVKVRRVPPASGRGPASQRSKKSKKAPCKHEKSEEARSRIGHIDVPAPCQDSLNESYFESFEAIGESQPYQLQGQTPLCQVLQSLEGPRAMNCDTSATPWQASGSVAEIT